MAKDTVTTPDRVSILVCADGPVVSPDSAGLFLGDMTGLSSGKAKWRKKNPGLTRSGTCQPDSGGKSTVKEATLEDLFRSHPPPIFTQIEEGIGGIGGRITALEERVLTLKGDSDSLRDYSFDSIVHALCMGFAIVMSFYVLGAIGSAILRALRLMD